MSDTFKTKNLGKRKRLNETTFKTEAMIERKCGSIDDKVEKLKLEEKERKRVEEQLLQEIEDLTA